VREAVRLVLGDMLKLNYVVDPQVQGAITAQTSRPLGRDAVLPTFEVILRANGASLVQEGAVYRVIPLLERAKESGRGGTPVITEMQRGLGFGLRVIPLKYVGPTQIQKVLDPFVPAGGNLMVDAARGVLIVSGTQTDLDGFTDLVDTLDVDALAQANMGLFTLRNASPQAVSDELEKVFGNVPDAQDAPPPLGGLLRFIPLTRLNAVLAISKERTYIERARTWVERLDRADAEGEAHVHVYYVQHSRAGDLAAVLGDALGAGVATELPQGVTAPGTTPALIAGSRSGGQFGGSQLGSGQFGGGLGATSSLGGSLPSPMGSALMGQGAAGAQPPPLTGRPGGGESQPGAGGPRSSASGLGALGGAGGPSGAPGAEARPFRIVADERNNALVVYAPAREYRLVEEALKRLDVIPLQVMIEATIAEVTLNDELRYGVQYFLREGNARFNLFDVAPPAGTTGITPTLPGFALVLGRTSPFAIISALSSVTHVNVVSTPQVLVEDHQTAYLQVGDSVPISTGQATNLNNPSTVLVNTIQYRDTGVILLVTPRANANGLVSMDVEQEVSAVSTAAATITPTFQERRIRSRVSIQSGETVALGGLIQDRAARSKSGIPILSSVPIVGSLFSTTDNTGVRTELLVLITPHVIGTAAQARDITDELRRRLRGIEMTPGARR
jgi:general secretion pathway protein D